VVWRFLSPFDTEFPAETLARLTDAERHYLRHYAYHSRFTGLYVLPGDHDRFMNHSDAPNVIVNPDGTATCVAARLIVAGEELTCDYRTFDREWATKLGCA
jgi:SET domain-containing protein